MLPFVRLRAIAPFIVLAVVLIIASAPGAAVAQTATFKLAFWNIQSGKGEPALPGNPVTFSDTSNCTDTTQPLNAWGKGVVQAHLQQSIANDPAIVALGLGEAWPCASPEKVREALGWKSRSSERNGVAIVAKYGFAGAEEWVQLDTTLNTNPADTMWVLRQPVCLDSACTRSINVFTAHWYGTGTDKGTSYDRQAGQTVEFLQRAGGAEPHVLIGDLNVWQGVQVCGQTPNDYGVDRLQGAGYLDAWPLIHGAAEGATGMVNRAGCGVPEGYTWKRIDYAWAPANFPALGIERFGMTTPGTEAPSDHYGIIAEFTLPGAPSEPAPAPEPTPEPDPDPEPAPAPAPIPTNGAEIVLHAKTATTIAGAWRAVVDGSAAGGVRMSHPDAGAAKLAKALATPANYFELTFNAEAGRAYRLWIRGRADRDYWGNDSVFVQFDGSIDASGTRIMRVGTADAATVNLEDGASVGLSGWGWQDNGYGVGALGPVVYFAASGAQTIRIQTREDGFSIDQIVLSPEQFLTHAPGPLKNDATILAASPTGSVPAPAPTEPATSTTEIVLIGSQATRFAGTWSFLPEATAAGGLAVGSPDVGAAKVSGALAAPANYVEFSAVVEAGRPYRLWLRGRAEQDYWGNDSAFVQFTNSVTSTGSAAWRIGTTDSTWVNLEDGSNAGLSGWGWQDNGYGAGVLGPLVSFATSGTQTIRIQTREDGFRIDQIVLSSEKYLQAAPGTLKNDTTILK
jgi:hypothetical protein